MGSYLTKQNIIVSGDIYLNSTLFFTLSFPFPLSNIDSVFKNLESILHKYTTKKNLLLSYHFTGDPGQVEKVKKELKVA